MAQTLQSKGFTRIKVIQGGMQAWEAAGYPMKFGAAPAAGDQGQVVPVDPGAGGASIVVTIPPPAGGAAPPPVKP